MSSMALGLVAAGELEHLRPALVSSLLHDRRHLGVGDEALPAVRIPVEDHPDPVVLAGIAEHERALGPVLLPLLGPLGREDVLELLEVLERRRCQEHDCPPCWGAAGRHRWEVSICPAGPGAHRANALRPVYELLLERPHRRGGTRA